MCEVHRAAQTSTLNTDINKNALGHAVRGPRCFWHGKTGQNFS